MRNGLKYLLAAFMAAICIPVAIAAVGVPPNPQGYVMPDAAWLNGIANGVNSSYQSGITASGTTQAGAFQLPSNITLIEVDTTPASSGVALPPALSGVEISIYNNGANTLTVYPSIANNPVTNAQDTINNASSTTITSHSSLYLFCAKNGVWAAK